MSPLPPDGPGGQQWHTVTISMPYPSPKDAQVAFRVLNVDRELKPTEVKRDLEVQGSNLIATFRTTTIRHARLSVNGFLDSAALVTRTIAEFGPQATVAVGAGIDGPSAEVDLTISS